MSVARRAKGGAVTMVTRPAEDEVRPWERQPGETARQFAYFRYYRDLPAEERTIRAAWEKCHGHPVDKRSVLRPWERLSGEKAWRPRAAAWDAELDRLARAKAVKEAVAAKRRRLTEAQWLHVQGIDRLREMAAAGESIPAAVALRMVEVGQNAERLEMGEATERTEAEVSAVSPEEAASREAQVQALLRLMFPLAEEGEKIETGAPVLEDGATA